MPTPPPVPPDDIDRWALGNLTPEDDGHPLAWREDDDPPEPTEAAEAGPDQAAADLVHYTDPRVRRLAETRWRLTTGGSRQDWLQLGKDNPEALIADARDWLRAVVAAGLLPLVAPSTGRALSVVPLNVDPTTGLPRTAQDCIAAAPAADPYIYVDPDSDRLHISHLDASGYAGEYPAAALAIVPANGDEVAVVYVPLPDAEHVVEAIRAAARAAGTEAAAPEAATR